MNIAFCVRSLEDSAALEARFGRTFGFVVIDSDSGRTVQRFKNEARDAGGSAGIKTVQLLADRNVVGIVAPHLGPKAHDACLDMGMRVWNQAEYPTVTAAFAAWQRGELDEATSLDHGRPTVPDGVHRHVGEGTAPDSSAAARGGLRRGAARSVERSAARAVPRPTVSFPAESRSTGRRIAIVSGKGGAGKTSVAVGLLSAGPDAVLLDCDVEEPNASLLMDGRDVGSEEFTVRYPVVDAQRCTNCGACARFCAFGALLAGSETVTVLPDHCHDCGGCARVCPVGAITYADRAIGRIRETRVAGRTVWTGELTVGELSGVKIIDALQHRPADDQLVWVDGPPGTACATTSAVEAADFVLLVAEPTPFGTADMAAAVELLERIGVPFGVVVNKAGIGDDEIYRFCRAKGIPIVGELPFDKAFAVAYAAGHWTNLSTDLSSEWTTRFATLADAAVSAAERHGRTVTR